MAAVADKIVAAPFAIIGSIGVVAGLPNFHRVLKKHEVDYYLFTAGKYKRTVTPLGEVTEEGQEKMQQDLEAIHHSFKKLIVDHRKEIDIEEVATGEFWLAEEAKEKGLVDEILTSDDYLFDKMKDFEIIEENFGNVILKYYGFLTLVFFPFYRSSNSRFFQMLVRLDQTLFKIKLFKYFAWSVLISGKKN